MSGKSAISIIVGRMKDKEKGKERKSSMSDSESDSAFDEEFEETEGSEVGVEYEAAAEDVLRSIESGNAADLAESLQSFFELCKHGE